MNGFFALPAVLMIGACVQADLERGGLEGRTAMACEEYQQTLTDLTAYRRHGMMSPAQIEEINDAQRDFRICQDREPAPDAGTVERMEASLREMKRIEREVIR